MYQIKEDTLFVLHCHQDDSHVLVHAVSVICDESVDIEDKVKFAYPGIKDFLDGTVKGVGGVFSKASASKASASSQATTANFGQLLKSKVTDGKEKAKPPKSSSESSVAKNQVPKASNSERQFRFNMHDDTMDTMETNEIDFDDGAKRVGKYKKRVRPATPPLQEFEGEFIIYNSDSPEAVVKLSTDYEVYISSKDLKICKKKCNTASALVRLRLRSVFTKEARAVCSVSGRPHLNRVTGEMERRPALDSDGVEAIIDFTNLRAGKKGWPKPSDSSLRQSMNNQLCETRAELKMKDEHRAAQEEMQARKLAKRCKQ